MVSQKGFDTACTRVWVPTCSPSLFLLKSGTNYAPPHPGRTVVVLSVGQMPGLGSRPRRYLAGPYHAFPDGHSGLCGSLKTQPGWLFLGSTAPPRGLVEEIGCALSHPSFQGTHLELCMARNRLQWQLANFLTAEQALGNWERRQVCIPFHGLRSPHFYSGHRNTSLVSIALHKAKPFQLSAQRNITVFPGQMQKPSVEHGGESSSMNGCSLYT